MRKTRSGISMKVHRIVTGHERRAEYATNFLQEGVVAVGWGLVGDLRRLEDQEIESRARKYYPHSWRAGYSVLPRFRDAIDVDDLVVAYMPPNKVAGVGTVLHQYDFDDSGHLGSQEGLGYPHHRSVEWMDEPRYFDRRLLPKEIASRLGKPGTMHTYQDMGDLLDLLADVPSGDPHATDEAWNEAQIRDYFAKNIELIEEGLSVTEKEAETQVGRIDILAESGDEMVVIEVKRTAGWDAVGQLLAYLQALREEGRKARGILLAEEIPLEVQHALKAAGLRGVECHIRFEPKQVV